MLLCQNLLRKKLTAKYGQTSNKMQRNLYLKTPQIRVNYIEEINIKIDAKKIKYYQISKIIIALYYCKLSVNSLAMITQFL